MSAKDKNGDQEIVAVEHKATCETNGHIYGHANQCVFCGTPRELPVLESGDVVVSKFGNRWRCEAREHLANGQFVYVLRNRPEEAPDAQGTVYSGPLPQWAERVNRDGVRLWQRPTPRCQCPTYAKAKGPYPSGFCPDCNKWYPGVTREQARSSWEGDEATDAKGAAS